MRLINLRDGADVTNISHACLDSFHDDDLKQKLFYEPVSESRGSDRVDKFNLTKNSIFNAIRTVLRRQGGNILFGKPLYSDI